MIGLAKPFKGNLNRLKAFTTKDYKKYIYIETILNSTSGVSKYCTYD